MTHIKRVPESALFFNLVSPAEDIPEAPVTAKRREPLLGTEAAVLETLLHQDGHPRVIAQRIEERALGRLFLQPDEIHWTLRRLERDGLVEASRVETPGHPLLPRIYRLTSEGRRVADLNRRAVCGLFGLAAPANTSLAP